MKMEFILDGDCLKVIVTGSIDTVTAPRLEKELQGRWKDINTLIFDFGAVDYVSSAGLRTLMAADKHMENRGKMKLQRVGKDVREIFEMTGFDELLTIE